MIVDGADCGSKVVTNAATAGGRGRLGSKGKGTNESAVPSRSLLFLGDGVMVDKRRKKDS